MEEHDKCLERVWFGVFSGENGDLGLGDGGKCLPLSVFVGFVLESELLSGSERFYQMKVGKEFKQF